MYIFNIWDRLKLTPNYWGQSIIFSAVYSKVFAHLIVNSVLNKFAYHWGKRRKRGKASPKPGRSVGFDLLSEEKWDIFVFLKSHIFHFIGWIKLINVLFSYSTFNMSMIQNRIINSGSYTNYTRLWEPDHIEQY